MCLADGKRDCLVDNGYTSALSTKCHIGGAKFNLMELKLSIKYTVFSQYACLLRGLHQVNIYIASDTFQSNETCLLTDLSA
jgi:hypothetical protein